MENNDVKDSLSQKLVGVLLISLFTVILWGGVQLINALTAKPADPAVEKYITPLPTSYSEVVLDEIEQRAAENDPIKSNN